MTHHFVRFAYPTFIMAGVALIGGCGPYQVTLNENPVYSPPALYSDFAVVDQALFDCLKQTVMDQKITRAEQLTKLVCRHAGIKTLDGIEHFSELKELDVSHNFLEDVTVLRALAKLSVLRLDNNPSLKCGHLNQLAQPNLQITSPTHCEN